MKKSLKKVLALVLVVMLVFSFAGCAKINYVTDSTIGAMKSVKDGTWDDADDAEAQADTAEVTIDEFVAGTYGGVEFKTEEDVVNYYVEAYNKTKSQTATYINDKGEQETWYALLGTESISIDSVLIEGKENSMINSLVPSIVDSLFAASTYGLPPCYNRNPDLDNNADDATKKADHDFRTSMLTAEDVEACNVTENSDGTIQLVIQPKAGSMSMRGDDSQGKFFEVLGDIGATVDSISVLSWASGTTEENCLVEYEGGTGTITIDPATGTVTAADYIMKVDVNVSHATVTVIKDKSAAVKITYEMKYPCDDQYLMDSKGAKRA